MIYFDNEIDIAAIYFVRKVTKNFIEKHKDLSLNEIPLSETPKINAFDNKELATLN
jgi:hypothetical protein